jgi:hypothetical protein
MSVNSHNQISVSNPLGKNSIIIGDFNFGVDGGDDYGPTYQTNFYKGIPVPVGGFVIYVNNSGTLTAHAPKDDNECLYYLNKYGANAINIGDALHWASFQSNLLIRSFEFPIEDMPGYGGLTGYWNIVTGPAGYAPAWIDGTITFPNTQSYNDAGLLDLSQVLTQGSIYINVLDSAGNDQSSLLGSAYHQSGTITFTQGNSNITFEFQNDSFEEGYFGAGVLYWDPSGSGQPADVTLVSSNHPIFTDGLVQITITLY